MLGAYDPGPSSGGLIIELARGKVPAIPGGRMNFVDVEAVAKRMLSAWKKGTRGERYILGGQNLTYHDFFHLVAKELGFQPPTFSIPKALALGIIISRFLFKWPDFAPSSLFSLLSSYVMSLHLQGLGWFGEAKQWWGGKEENLNISRVRYAYCENWVFSSEKARKELDYPILPLEPAIHRAVDWWKQKGMYPLT